MVFTVDLIRDLKTKSSLFQKDSSYYSERTISHYLESLRLISDNMDNTRAVLESFHIPCPDSSIELTDRINQMNINQIMLSKLETFLQFYYSLYYKFMNTKLGQDEAILLYKEYIETYNNPVRYKNTLYNYTNLGYNMTCTRFKNEINNVLCDLVRDLKDFSGYKRNYDSFHNVELGEKRLFKFKDEMSQVYQSELGVDHEVSRGNLSAELYQHYRQGKFSENDLVPPSRIQQILHKYLSLNKMKSFVTNHKQKTFQFVQELQEVIRTIDFTKYIRSSITSQECKSYLSLIETAFRKIDDICNFYLQKFGAWLDSITQENYCYEDFLKEVLRVMKEEDTSDMVTMEDYLFNYDIYLAEQELFDSFMKIQSSSILEDVDITYINESVKDIILRYLNKISTSIEGAWNKFKQTVFRDVDKKYLQSIRDKMQNPNPRFTISNYPTYNTAKLEETKLVPFNYGEMKEFLESKNAFIEKYYPDLASPEKSTIEMLESLSITGRQDTRCTPEILKMMYKFASSDFETKVSGIEADLRTVNKSNTNIQQVANQITQGTTTTPTAPNQSNDQEQNDNKEEGSEEGKSVGYKDDKQTEAGDNSSLIKQISIYMKASTDILSAKMKIYRDIYALYMKTLRHYTRAEEKKQKAQRQQKAEEPKKPQVEQPKTQVNI